jgi:uncharacterized protein (DUF1697 family)
MRYVAFLRAVNVGGRVVKMGDLKAAFESLAVKNVQTFIASGNVIFDTTMKDPAVLERKAERCLQKAFGYEVATYLRSIEEVAEIAGREPFPAAAISHGAVIYVGFLPSGPGAAERRKLMSLTTEVHDFHVAGREVFWLRRRDLAGAGFDAPPIEKALGLRATFRNIRTVQRIATKYA